MLKILIAVDGSEHANRAIEYVAAMARSSIELQSLLLCVSPEPIFYGDYTANTIKSIEEDQKIQQTTILSDAMDLARRNGLKVVETLRAHGNVANEIVRVAQDRHVDQIAMGTRGMGALGNVFMGSVAQRVIHQSSCPVLLVR